MSSMDLRYVREHYGKNLEDTVLIGCSHLLEGNYLLIKELLHSGLAAQNTYIIPKSYSYNETIAKRMEELGVYVHHYTYDSHQPFDSLFSQEVSRYLAHMQDKIKDKNVIVMDDGGFVLDEVIRQGIYAVGVEQTSSGYHKIKHNCTIPAVNVARSDAKLEYETPHIATHFVQQLLGQCNPKQRTPAVLGKGSLGLALAELLNAPAFEEGECKLSDYDLLIGASGQTSIAKEDHAQLRKGTILASVSSSDREFDAVHIRRAQPKSADPHKHYTFERGVLLNGGFPLTFDGGTVAVPTKNIILTHALMLAGIYQAIGLQDAGMHNLTYQREIIEAYT